MLISSGLDRRDVRRDLLAGDIASAVAVVPVMVVAALVLATVSGGWRHLGPALGCGLALLAISVALSGAVAVTTPFPVPESRNAFSSGSAGQGIAGAATSLVAMGVEVVLALPLLALLLPALMLPSTALGLLLLVLGPAYGLVVGALVRRAASRRWEQRAPEVLQAVRSAG